MKTTFEYLKKLIIIYRDIVITGVLKRAIHDPLQPRNRLLDEFGRQMDRLATARLPTLNIIARDTYHLEIIVNDVFIVTAIG
jgi:hypothetical protein